MKLFLSFLLLLFSQFALSQVVPGSNVVPSITMSGVVVPISRAVILTGFADTTTQFATLYRNNAAYQVPSGRKLIIVAVRAFSAAANAGGVTLGYGDTSVSGTSAPTNSVAFANSGISGSYVTGTSTSAGANLEGMPTYFEVPSLKFPFMRVTFSTATSICVVGYLE